jgi:methionine-S-sulfoxide reductase
MKHFRIISWLALFAIAGINMSAYAKDDQQALQKEEKATFAGGCFWCMEPVFEALKGVLSVRAGYTGGHVPKPTYEQVCSGNTGHAEAVQIVYDPVQISYEELLEAFWKSINPTTPNQQFSDHGSQYRTAIFYHNEEQQRLAEISKQKIASMGKFKEPIATEITPAGEFFEAEEYHQDYYKKNALHYKLYKKGSGREDFINKTWKNVPPGLICPLRSRLNQTKKDNE